MSIDDEPLGDVPIPLPPLPAKSIQHAWYDRYAGEFGVFLHDVLEQELPSSTYSALTEQAKQQARFYLMQMVANTLMQITTQTVTKHKVGES